MHKKVIEVNAMMPLGGQVGLYSLFKQQQQTN